MNLIFLGRGSAFNAKERNTSAYFIENKDLFLIDCGESIFKTIIKNNLLENINSINLIITHTHSDHIGSLGSLVLYCFHVLKKQLRIIISKDAKHISDIKNILNSFGCTKVMYNFIDEKEFDNRYETFEKIRYKETLHSKELKCYGIEFTTKKGITYYSGDTKEINYIKKLIDKNQVIDKLYVDTTTINIPDNVHVYIEDLYKEIPKELRDHVYCMHINSDDCIKRAKALGFNVVEYKY